MVSNNLFTKSFLSKRYKGIYYLFYRDPQTGRRISQTTKTTTLKEAKEFQHTYLTQLQSELNATVTVPAPVPYTIDDLQNKILELNSFRISKGITEAKINKHAKFIARLFEFLKLYTGGNKLLSDLTSLEMESWKFKRAEDVSQTSVNIELRTIKAWFNKSIVWGMLSKNPLKGVKQFQIPQKERVCFTDEEIKLVLSYIVNQRIKDIVEFALYSGCRISEIINLEWPDVDFENKTITIRNKVGFTTKTKKFRVIPMSAKLEEILRRKLAERVLSQWQYVFGKENGYKYDTCYVSRKFKKYLNRANLPSKFHFHCLRHTFATNFIKSTHNIYYAKNLLGHSNIKTTEIYLHADNDSLLKAMNQMEGLTA